MHTDTDLAHPGERRVGGLWLILRDDRVLVVNPNYDDKTGKYQLVGGGAHPEEPPHQAAIREGEEEIGLTMVPRTLLVTDYMPANPDHGAKEGLNFVWLHRLGPDEKVTLNAGHRARGEKPELVDFKLLSDAELDEHCAEYQARRIRAAMAAAADPTKRGYLVRGRPVAQAA
jgi:8-oxo-dGTP diphosphatase